MKENKHRYEIICETADESYKQWRQLCDEDESIMEERRLQLAKITWRRSVSKMATAKKESGVMSSVISNRRRNHGEGRRKSKKKYEGGGESERS